jgi:hypothetical protein
MLVLDEAVKSLRDDALQKIRAALLESGLAANQPAKTAHEILLLAMRAGLPPPVLLNFTITEARFAGKGANRRAITNVKMFDGQAARLAVWRYAHLEGAWAHEWLDLPGSSVAWEQDRWTRTDGEQGLNDASFEPVSSVVKFRCRIGPINTGVF